VSLFSLKPEPVVGIDISTTAVKLLELSKTSSGYRVESYAFEPLPETAVVDKNINENEIEVVGAAIARAVKKAKPKAGFAAVSVSGPAVMTKIIPMDGGMSDADILAQIEMDAEQLIPFPLEEVNLDFEVLGPNEREPDRVDILLAVSRSENVDARVSTIEMGGLKTRVVDIDKYALENAFHLLVKNDPEISEEDTIALVEVGAVTTTLNVMGENRIVFTREDMFGGKRLTEDIQHNYGLSYDEAQMAKRSGTLPEEYASTVLEAFKEDVAQEISRLIQYYYSTSTYGKLSHILVAGGCASIPGIVDNISNKVGGHVTIVNPFIGMSVADKVDKKNLMIDAPALLIACGLALRTFDEY
jgi:type IV pilus assembly protein PilM